MLTLMGFLGAITQYCWVQGLKHETASRVTSLSLLGIVIGFTFDAAILHYDLQMKVRSIF